MHSVKEGFNEVTIKSKFKKLGIHLNTRQKAIHLADYSEYSCSVVAEYDADKLAKNSDDKRKIGKETCFAAYEAWKLQKAFYQLAQGG